MLEWIIEICCKRSAFDVDMIKVLTIFSERESVARSVMTI